MDAADPRGKTSGKLVSIRNWWKGLSRSSRVAGRILAAATVALGLVSGVEWAADAVGFTPPSDLVYGWLHQPPDSELIRITAGVRHRQSAWVQETTINGGLDPHFDVQINYRNISGKDLADVVISIDPIGHAIPIDGTALMIDKDNPRGISINNDVLSPSGLNLGSPEPNADVYVRISYRLSSANLPCGRNTMSFRAHARAPDVDDGKAVDSNEAVVIYNNDCLPGSIDRELVPALPPAPSSSQPAPAPTP